ncbi:protein of unknown function [Cribrihabitans marinus]|uniref:DUF3576 domain-containing protein n=1 Tax=Cribrihabitans marinus TaxID=1227549 RepID=A0A1H6XXR9_9RHOB|nr:DUF3576 domain-containing protein [Cribrihabitans marinus]GGH27619.1 hypothetical protein GCM10010973_16000 [Cribrihabitans marinus]SEJ29640.1 protein of unknown function [Cribrihabitans marinus]
MRRTVKFGLIALLSVQVACSPAATSTNRAGDPRLTGGNPDEITDFEGRSTIWDLFGPDDTENKVGVNKYLWAASLDVLSFLPVQSVDPFTGVIVTGYGTPPGGGRSYRATVHVRDPALDARSLNVSLQSRGGPVSRDTARAVEDAILSRARQLRVADGSL